jgi:hypothetical protein
MTTTQFDTTTMLDKVTAMLEIVDQYYGDNLRRELENLREALDSGDAEAVEDVYNDTVQGCASAMTNLETLAILLEDLK